MNAPFHSSYSASSIDPDFSIPSFPPRSASSQQQPSTTAGSQTDPYSISKEENEENEKNEEEDDSPCPRARPRRTPRPYSTTASSSGLGLEAFRL